MGKITDPDVQILAGISASLQSEYLENDSQWKDSPFSWIKTRPSRQIGAIGEKLVAGWLAARGFNISRASNSDSDRVIENLRTEIKFSTLWANGNYKFQQLRDQEYDIVVCLGVSPFDAHCWVIPKSAIIRLWKIEKKIQSQHGGAAGTDTAWIDVPMAAPPRWLHEYGGSLRAAITVLSSLSGYTPKPVLQEIDEQKE